MVVFQDESQEKIKTIQDLIDGDLKDLSELEQITDWSQISKLHGVKKIQIQIFSPIWSSVKQLVKNF